MLLNNMDVFGFLSYSSIVPKIFKNVVLPAPEGPTIDMKSPFFISIEILSNTN